MVNARERASNFIAQMRTLVHPGMVETVEECIYSLIMVERHEQQEHYAKMAEDHSKNCGACGCDGWQIADSIRHRDIHG